MSEPATFPPWIVEAFNKHQGQINPKSKEFFEKLLELSPHFDNAFLSIPATSDIGALKSYEPNEVQRHLGLESPHEFILLNICETFHFQATYQLRELGLSLLSSLTEGRFFVSAITSRAMMEVVCVNYYTFRRVEKHLKQCLGWLKEAARTKSDNERTRILNSYYQGTLEICSKLFDANAASSISWSEYLQDQFKIKIESRESLKKIHVHDAIKDLEKPSGLPLMAAYDVLSEFVHPNAGSKMLIINTKKAIYPFMDALTIGDNKGNSEAALFYIDHLSESMFYTWNLALTLSQRGQELLAVLDSLVPIEFSKKFH
jgi:hypothetical protein